MRKVEKNLEFLINNLNATIKHLRDNGIKIFDNGDFDYCLDYVYYSPAMDEVIFRTRYKEDDEE